MTTARLGALTVASFMLLLSTPAFACRTPAPPAHALSKVGSCPSGYSTSGKYCKPSRSSARFAIQKVGSCASGYSTSGAYCLGR